VGEASRRSEKRKRSGRSVTEVGEAGGRSVTKVGEASRRCVKHYRGGRSITEVKEA